MGVVDDAILVLRPGSLLDVWVEVVVPPLPALLPNPSLQVLRDQGPPVAKMLFILILGIRCSINLAKVRVEAPI